MHAWTHAHLGAGARRHVRTALHSSMFLLLRFLCGTERPVSVRGFVRAARAFVRECARARVEKSRACAHD
eukprot:3737708-Pleurochrysis_carterae.AAC.1